MSQRFGMADGRCFTNMVSNNLIQAKFAELGKVHVTDSTAFREFMQKNGDQVVKSMWDNSACLSTSLNIKHTK
jgi:hypothetical protein